MPSSSKPLYVRLPSSEADRLDVVATATGKSKRQLVSEAIRGHLTDDGLTVGHITLPEGAPEIMTLVEAAAFLRLDEAQLAVNAAQGGLPARQIGDEWRFSRAAILTWLGAEAASTE